jgi:hypothetical protein
VRTKKSIPDGHDLQVSDSCCAFPPPVLYKSEGYPGCYGPEEKLARKPSQSM